MNIGKKTCETLKQIRQQVADANGISYAPTPCTHKGNCPGTCPVCEAEARYIEQELSARRLLGKAIVVAGIAAGMASLTSCNQPKSEKGIKVSEFEQMVEGKIPVKGKSVVVEESPNGVVVPDTIAGEVAYSIYSVIPPEFPGGLEARLKYLTIELPPASLTTIDDTLAIVRVTVILGTDGNVKKAWVNNSDNEELHADALRLVRNMPAWKPAKLKDKNVSCWMPLSVVFVRP